MFQHRPVIVSKNDQRNAPSLHILLVRKILVTGHKNVHPGILSAPHQFAILSPEPTLESRRKYGMTENKKT